MSETNQNIGQVDQSLNLIIDKADRLTAAVYMVTNYLNDSEPLKWQLRELSLMVVKAIKDITPEEVVSINSKTVFYKNLTNPQIAQNLKSLISLLNIGVSSGSVSTMNFSLLKDEYQKLTTYLDKSSNDQIKQFTLSNFAYPDLNFKTDLLLNKAGGDNFNPNSSFKTISYKDVPTKHVQSIGQPKMAIKSQQTKSNRQEDIASFLKDRGWVSITDITQAVPGVSSKTIQRELTVMVAKGQLKKKGDRRWSRYLLN